MTLTRIGKYEIVTRIGRGAMGEVYKAHDPVLARFVAIKTISSLLDADKPQRERFLREARAAAQLNHPNIITIFDFGEEEGVAFIVMELLEGTDLKDIIDGRALNRIDDKLAVMEQIADGLAFAHAKGMVHRDLKPGNIHVLPNGQVKIMDFGLALRSTDTSRSEDIIGTPNYMSPEQVKGERAGPRSDIFSVGGVLYELIAGRKPFGADTIPAVLFNVVHKEAEPLEKWIPELPVVARVVEKCLAKDPSQRFADATELREALRGVRQTVGGDLAAGAALAASLASDTVHIIAKPRVVPKPLSEAEDTGPGIKEALQELQQYLADSLPPLMVAESVGQLLGCPPEGVAADVYAWALRQTRGQATVPLAGLLLHALAKIHQMGELKLIEKESLGAYLQKVGDALIGFCPSTDEEPLRRGLELLRSSGMVEPAPVPEPPVPPALAEAGRRVKLLLDRLRQDAGAKVDPANDSRRQLVAEALAAVVFTAGSGRELDEQLDYLRHFGIESGIAQVFRSLGQALSDWIVPPGAAPAGPPPEGGGGRQVEAMRRVITLAEEPVEAAKRFRDLVYAAIEQFNQGNLGRAVKMIEVAERLVEENQIEAPYVETVRRKGHESLDQGRVRSFAESPDRHPALRKILNFFFFGLGVSALIGELQVEERRDRRRLLLTLLQAHGPAAREAALARVEAFVEGRDDPGPFLLRNLLSLLRHIPREADEPPDEEIEAVALLAEPGRAAIVSREAILYLGVTRHPKARQALIKLIRDYEGRLAHPDLAAETREEWEGFLDKITSGLARQGGAAAWTVVVEHALGGAPGVGDSLGRLTALSGQDLSSSPPLVERLLGQLRTALPRSVLGFKVSKKDPELLSLVEALSGTTAPEVRQLFAEIAERFPGDGFGRAAARALEGTAGTRAATDLPMGSHTGEIEAFGLPILLNRLREGEATGRLTLHDREERALGAMTLAQGRLVACEAGVLRGPEAVYALLERPNAGKFSFEARAVEAEAPEQPSLDVPALTVEGMRRYGELQRASALVPDDAALEATGSSPTAVPDEQDYDLVVILWQKACAGVTARQCEVDLPVDPYRIRRAMAHWFEEGALRRRTAEAPAEPPPRNDDAAPAVDERRPEEHVE